jgi:hypothetical protein
VQRRCSIEDHGSTSLLGLVTSTSTATLTFKWLFPSPKRSVPTGWTCIRTTYFRPCESNYGKVVKIKFNTMLSRFPTKRAIEWSFQLRVIVPTISPCSDTLEIYSALNLREPRKAHDHHVSALHSIFHIVRTPRTRLSTPLRKSASEAARLQTKASSVTEMIVSP